jgi:hypothetical protein
MHLFKFLAATGFGIVLAIGEGAIGGGAIGGNMNSATRYLFLMGQRVLLLFRVLEQFRR